MAANFQNIVILGTGGTIAGRASTPGDSIGYTAAQVGIDQLLASIASLADNTAFITEQVAQIDSKDMDFSVWVHLAGRARHFLRRPDVQGIVITHGTDTLEETAFFLQQLCQPAKPVVLTCAMRPASALVPDGPQNLVDAVAVARHAGAAGVVVVCAGAIHSAEDVQKVHTYRLDAFSSGDAGALGYVEEGVAKMARNWPFPHVPYDFDAIESVANWPWVEIITSCAGADPRLVRALMEQGVDGIVVAGTGNGTIHHRLMEGLLEAQAAGVQVVRATRCVYGRVLPVPGSQLPDSGGRSPAKARVALMLNLLTAQGTRARPA